MAYNYIPCSFMDRERKIDEISTELNDFFCELEDNCLQNTNKLAITYREQQQDYALAIMKAIKNKEILLIQAGVGTGKSFGYLLPVFYTMNGITTFDKVIISTSSIGLQEQIMKDINYISQLLKTPIKAWLSKGMNNYACLKRIDELMISADRQKDEKLKETIKSIKREILQKGTCDKSELIKVNGTLWKRIQVCGGCDTCNYKDCAYRSVSHHILNMPIIVTNHTQLANMLNNKHDSITSSSLMIIDEAHKLEEEIRLSTESSISLTELKNKFNLTMQKFNEKNDFYEYDLLDIIQKDVDEAIFRKFAVYLRANSISARKKQEIASGLIIDDKIPFNISNSNIKRATENLIIQLKKTINILSQSKKRYIIPELKYFKNCLAVFEDMIKENQDNIYWSKLVQGEKTLEVELFYSKKDISPILKEIYNENKPVVLTSATIDTGNGKYSYLKKSLCLENETRVTTETPLESPFNYEENSLFYYATDLINPKLDDRTQYLAALVERIKDLIDTTEGKTMILFTSKKDMTDVYNIMKQMDLKYKLIFQEDRDVKKCKDEFSNDENSCLFATGAFWEGVDIKGKTLSNVIIVRLPFPVQDRLVEYKKENLNAEEAQNVDINAMITKLAQGTGRLIRSVDDTGLVCCLDPRITNYLEQIKNALPFKNYTNDLSEVAEFAKKKITNHHKEEQEKNHILKPIK